MAMGFRGCGLWVVGRRRGASTAAHRSKLLWVFFFFFGYEMEICGWVRCVAGVGFVFVLSGGFVFSDHLSCTDLLCGNEIVSRFGFMVVL
jgi:hypothetical protein